ncbi:MAG: MFS transporter [Candidatus Zixiibacteriota bacterium]
MSKSAHIFRKDVISWSLYDFANTIYSMNIVSLYFKRWIVEDLGHDGLYYDISYSLSMFLAGLIMPALGAISDHSRKKKLFLFLFTITCCFWVGIIPAIPPSLFMLIIIAFAFSNFFYEGGMVFYNSLLYSVSNGNEARLVSGFGVALGYTGSIVGMILVLPWVTGSIFGFDIIGLDGAGKTGAFLPTAVLFLVFSIPLFIWVKERKTDGKKEKVRIGQAYKEVWEGIRGTKKYPGVLRFLIADYFFEDAIATVILNMGIFSSVVLGFSDADLTIFMIVSTLSAMIGSFVIGRISQTTNLKKLLSYIVWGWIVTLLLFIFTSEIVIIYIIGSILGVLLGGTWTVSRPLLAEMVPKEELGRFFGLYSLSGRAAAVLGPIVWGSVVYLFNMERPLGAWLTQALNLNESQAVKIPYKLGVLSLILMMALGLYILRKLPDGTGEKR